METATGKAIVNLKWATQDDKPVLVDGVRDRLLQILHDLACDRGYRVLFLMATPDYVHICLDFPPTDSIEQIAQFLRGHSAAMLRNEFPHLTSLWTKGYLFSTAGTPVL